MLGNNKAMEQIETTQPAGAALPLMVNGTITVPLAGLNSHLL